ncbi:hypothetical protein ACQCSX_00485 [Pseudarthrobacter sp. P1]|uniref:hypothetical protein n=1 Tax=Pseudarthrobacter sp. P1 TaxID=3418418 RepID=UPI003CE98372
MSEPADSGLQSYPPPAYAPAVPPDLATAPPARLATWAGAAAAAGVPVGVLWWLLAPGGAWFVDGADFMAWLPRDGVLALLGVVAGIATAAILLPRRRKAGTAARAGAAVAGSLAGSVLAWRLGELAGGLAGKGSGDGAFVLRATGVLFLWPLAAAAVLFAGTVVSLLRSGPSREA